MYVICRLGVRKNCIFRLHMAILRFVCNDCSLLNVINYGGINQFIFAFCKTRPQRPVYLYQGNGQATSQHVSLDGIMYQQLEDVKWFT